MSKFEVKNLFVLFSAELLDSAFRSCGYTGPKVGSAEDLFNGFKFGRSLEWASSLDESDLGALKRVLNVVMWGCGYAHHKGAE